MGGRQSVVIWLWFSSIVTLRKERVVAPRLEWRELNHMKALSVNSFQTEPA